MSDSKLQQLHIASKTVARETEIRNELILQARLDGWPWATIAEATGLTINGVEKIARRMNGGIKPIPKTQVKPTFN